MRVDCTTASLAAESEEKNNEVDVQPENDPWLRLFIIRITDAFHYYFPKMDEQSPIGLIN